MRRRGRKGPMKDDQSFNKRLIPDKSDRAWRAALSGRLRWRARAQPGLTDEERAENRRLATGMERIDWYLSELPLAEHRRLKDKRESLQREFERVASREMPGAKEELAYRHMVALADMFEGWSMDKRVSQRKSALILGWAESLRTLAHEVGPDWDPPRPARLSLLGFIARRALGET